MKIIKVKEFEVPIGIIADVADSNDLTNKIKGTDEEHGFVFLEVNFDRYGENHTAAYLEIENAIKINMNTKKMMKRRTRLIIGTDNPPYFF